MFYWLNLFIKKPYMETKINYHSDGVQFERVYQGDMQLDSNKFTSFIMDVCEPNKTYLVMDPNDEVAGIQTSFYITDVLPDVADFIAHNTFGEYIFIMAFKKWDYQDLLGYIADLTETDMSTPLPNSTNN